MGDVDVVAAAGGEYSDVVVAAGGEDPDVVFVAGGEGSDVAGGVTHHHSGKTHPCPVIEDPETRVIHWFSLAKICCAIALRVAVFKK